VKLRQLSVWSLSGMLVSCTTVYAIVPPPPRQAHAVLPNESELPPPSTLRLDARVGYPRVRVDGERRTHLLVELGAPVTRERSIAPASNTALVLDRSGSMVGQPMQHAREAAAAWIESSADGDTVSVLAFDGSVEWVLPPTVMNAESRARGRAAVTKLGLGGSTCMSCAVEEVMSQFSATDTRVQRVVMLSDGEANKGTLTLEGFSELAARCRQRGVTVTTVGLGTGYNEKILSLLSFESNGRHHFVAESKALPEVFAREAEVLRSTIATAVEAEVALAPGVELLEVADRAHLRRDGKLIVPLGALAAGAQKTVLLEVRVPPELGRRELAKVSVRAHTGQTEREERTLFVDVHPKEQSPLDPLVAMRIERGRTASVLRQASQALDEGRREQALDLLDRHDASLQASARDLAERRDRRSREIQSDLSRQLAATRASREDAEREPRAASKRAIAAADPWSE